MFLILNSVRNVFSYLGLGNVKGCDCTTRGKTRACSYIFTYEYDYGTMVLNTVGLYVPTEGKFHLNLYFFWKGIWYSILKHLIELLHRSMVFVRYRILLEVLFYQLTLVSWWYMIFQRNSVNVPFSADMNKYFKRSLFKFFKSKYLFEYLSWFYGTHTTWNYF